MFLGIRQWPWWRLLTKVLPLVEVTRTEEELNEAKVAELVAAATSVNSILKLFHLLDLSTNCVFIIFF